MNTSRHFPSIVYTPRVRTIRRKYGTGEVYEHRNVQRLASSKQLLLMLFKEKSFFFCLHIKNRSDLYPVPFSFLLFKAKKRISVVTR